MDVDLPVDATVPITLCADKSSAVTDVITSEVVVVVTFLFAPDPDAADDTQEKVPVAVG